MSDSNSNVFSDNSLDLARMYGFDPYNVNNGQGCAEAEPRDHKDILDQIYNDEASKAPMNNKDLNVDSSTDTCGQECSDALPNDQSSSDLAPPPQGDQTFPTQHGEESGNDLDNSAQDIMQAENMGQNNMGQNNMQIEGMGPRNMGQNNMQIEGMGPRNMQANDMQVLGDSDEILQNMDPNDISANYSALRNAEIIPNDIKNINTFMKTQIGKNITVQSKVEEGPLIEKSGMLVFVGRDYIILNENRSGDHLLIFQIPAIRFIKFA